MCQLEMLITVDDIGKNMKIILATSGQMIDAFVLVQMFPKVFQTCLIENLLWISRLIGRPEPFRKAVSASRYIHS